ncbi:MAG: hypothetical protein ACK4YD_05680 [Chitinophagia bacterium]
MIDSNHQRRVSIFGKISEKFFHDSEALFLSNKNSFARWVTCAALRAGSAPIFKNIFMKSLFFKFFGFRTKRNSIEEFPIESNMPLTVKGIPYSDVLRMKWYLENLKVGQSFPIKPIFAYTVRKIANQHFQEYKISIRNTGEFHRVYRLA